MPHYFFSTTNNGHVNDRDEPLELPDAHAAWTEATSACGEILKEIDGKFTAPGEWRMDVRDHAQRPLFSLRVIAELHQQDAGVNRAK